MALYLSDPTASDAVVPYGVPARGAFEFIVEPGSFLDEYLKSGLKLPERLGNPRGQELFELMLEEGRPTPGFRVDPSQLDLREYRRPGPAYPGEHLDRDRFLLTNPRSPLT